METAKLEGWKTFTHGPGTEQIILDFQLSYLKISPHKASGEATLLNDLLEKAIGCIDTDWRPLIGISVWSVSATFRAAPGSLERVKILFPFCIEESGQKKLELPLAIYTRGSVVETDVEKIIKNLTILFNQASQKMIIGEK